MSVRKIFNMLLRNEQSPPLERENQLLVSGSRCWDRWGGDSWLYTRLFSRRGGSGFCSSEDAMRYIA